MPVSAAVLEYALLGDAITIIQAVTGVVVIFGTLLSLAGIYNFRLPFGLSGVYAKRLQDPSVMETG